MDLILGFWTLKTVTFMPLITIDHDLLMVECSNDIKNDSWKVILRVVTLIRTFAGPV
jgi:hypothetical protein